MRAGTVVPATASGHRPLCRSPASLNEGRDRSPGDRPTEVVDLDTDDVAQ